MSKKLTRVYNPESTETTNERRVFGGEPSGMYELNDIRYQWAVDLWDRQMANTWFPSEVNLNKDKKEYHDLSEGEKKAYDRTLAQLIFMDSIQTTNLVSNINGIITASEISLTIIRMAFEETLHSKSYAVMVDSISDNGDEIYDLWKRNNVLKERNDAIADVYNNLIGDDSDENCVLAFYANQALEGVYFYSGFLVMYTLARHGKMLGSSQMIRYINRDEITHLEIFQNIILSVKEERPDLFTDSLRAKVVKMFKAAVELEISWGSHTIEDGLLGLNPAIIREYVQFIADERMRAVNEEPIYNSSNPVAWVDDFSSFNEQRANVFEATNTNYAVGSVDMDDF